MKKIYLLISILSSFSNVYGSDFLEDHKNILKNTAPQKTSYKKEFEIYLKKLGKVTNTNDISHNLGNSNIDKVFKMSSESIKYGVSWFLNEPFSDLQKDKVTVTLAKTYGAQLEGGTSIEELNFDKTNWDKTKLIFQTVLNNFCWQDGKTTEITLDEVAANMILRKRISGFITKNDQ